MIKFLLDPQILTAQRFGGISRYHTEVYDILKRKDNIQINCPVLYTQNKHFAKSHFFNHSYQQKHKLLIKYSKIFKPYRPSRLIQKTNQHTISQIERQDFDVFIPTYYDPYFLNALKNKPFVLTVHDMIYELFPHYFLDDQDTALNKKMLMEKAAKIIAVSENTKADILKVYPHIPASKVEVIYLATTINYNRDIILKLPNNYILFVGNRSLYKNFTFFLKSTVKILKERPDLFLICAGGTKFNSDEVQLINEFGIASQVIQQDFDDSELFAYYKNAKCFIFPSVYEGFGIPVLEAMTCGCPIILANHSSFPEVAGNAGVYFRLNDMADLTSKIELLLDNPRIRHKHISEGLEQAQKFSWENTAQQTLQVYREVAEMTLFKL